MAMAEDYYKTLGVPKNASAADIQKAYRALARKYHPDMNPDDKSAKKKFQQVQTAFDVLNNPEKREMYDRYGSSFETMGAGGPGGPGGPQGAHTWNWSPGAGGAGPGGFSPEDIDMSQFFGERFNQEGGGRWICRPFQPVSQDGWQITEIGRCSSSWGGSAPRIANSVCHRHYGRRGSAFGAASERKNGDVGGQNSGRH